MKTYSFKSGKASVQPIMRRRVSLSSLASTARGVFSILSLIGVGTVVACSASSSDAGGGAADADGGASGSCSCELSYNGAKRTISCGTDTCLNGATFACGNGAEVTQGGTCKDTSNAGAPTPGTRQAGQTCSATDRCAQDLYCADVCVPSCSKVDECGGSECCLFLNTSDTRGGCASKNVAAVSGGIYFCR
jgi:hypothetical protein